MRGSSACRPRHTPAKTWKSLSRKLDSGLAGGVVLGLLTFLVYMIGSNRSFGYDAAATNDHVLLSLISHVIFSLTGSRSEAVYRVIPALAAGATVGVSTTVLVRRFGLLAGLCAGLFIATDPLFVDNSRDLRGYSLAALGSVAGTLLLVGPRSRWRLAAYALVMGLAIAAQLFAVVVLACHAAWLLARRSGFRELLPAWVAAAAIGVAANANIYVLELTRHGLPPPLFNPTFPRDLALFLIGAPVLLPVGLWLATVGLGIW